MSTIVPEVTHGVSVAQDLPRWLPIYYLQPLEIIAMALSMGEKKWAKCEEEGRRRKAQLSTHCRAVAFGADVRATLRKDHDMRPPPEWLHEAGITVDSLRKARELVFDNSNGGV